MKKSLSILVLGVLILGNSGGVEAAKKSNNLDNDLNLKGDFRLRYQNQKMESGVSRTRNRIRFRLGGSKRLSDNNTVKFGVATGGTDSRSTNQTLQDNFQSPDLRLDYAYIKHNVSKGLSILGGKMKNPLWRPSDLLWDGDINPDGAAIQYRAKSGELNWFVSGGYFILDELSATVSDPALLAIQPGVKFALNETTKAKAAIGYYVTQDTKGLVLDQSAGTNTGATTGLEKETTTLVVSGQMDFTNQFGFALIRPFAEYVTNTNTTTDNNGYIVGVKFGDKRLDRQGSWQAEVNYRYLQTDAWLDTLPDADSYGGATNAKGLELALNYGLSKSTTFRLDYFNMDVISGTSDAQTIVQADLSFKF